MSALAGRQAGRHVVVTGAGTGIGRAIALRLAEEGARLSLLARGVERLRETAAEIAASQPALEVHVASCDIRDRAQVDDAFAVATRELGPLSALVANAGIGGPNEPSGSGGSGGSGSEDRFDDLVATNLTGTYSCLRAAQRHLAPGPKTRQLVVIASILARIGVAGYTGYCASKAALGGLVRALAVELAPDGVQVDAIAPGWVDTSMAREGLEGMAQAMGCDLAEARRTALADVPLGRMSAPEDVAGMTAWLLSPDARGVTGQMLDMNGGAFMI